MTLLAIPAGCQMLRTERWFWHPAGVRPLTVPEPGGIAPLDPRLPSGIPPGCPSPTSPPLIYSTGNSEELPNGIASFSPALRGTSYAGHPSRAGRGWLNRSGCFKYFRAVFRSIPLLIALIETLPVR